MHQLAWAEAGRGESIRRGGRSHQRSGGGAWSRSGRCLSMPC